MKIIFIILLFVSILNSKQSDDVEISNAYIRLMPPMMKMTAAFMDIKNLKSKNIKIIKVSSDLSEFTEIHTHVINKDGTAVMAQLKELKIKANSTHFLQKGSDHIMFIGLKKRLKLGESHKIILYFADDSQKEVSLEIKKL